MPSMRTASGIAMHRTHGWYQTAPGSATRDPESRTGEGRRRGEEKLSLMTGYFAVVVAGAGVRMAVPRSFQLIKALKIMLNSP
jgi:hypothetical protein